MALRLTGYVDLPRHRGPGGFDHAAVHRQLGRVYVAHTANDAVGVIDIDAQQHHGSIENLTGVAGALVSEECNLIFTSNRGENTVGIFAPDDPQHLARIPVGMRPNGLSFDARRDLLFAAHVGDRGLPGSFTVSVIKVAARAVVADIPVPGRTRWTIVDPASHACYVNIADPSQIVVIDADALRVSRVIPIPATGPHGLDADVERRRLFCACDGDSLVEVDLDSAEIIRTVDLTGAPDVIFFNSRLRHLYVAVGDPGVIEVFDTAQLRPVQRVLTERDAHTMAFDSAHDTLYALLPETHRAAIFLDAE